jgi:hypothetical protein
LEKIFIVENEDQDETVTLFSTIILRFIILSDDGRIRVAFLERSDHHGEHLKSFSLSFRGWFQDNPLDIGRNQFIPGLLC